MYTCSTKPFDPKIMDTLSSHFLSQVIGNAKKPFYDRRPQSRIRINTMAHAGFCGACGPCSCKTTPASSAGAGDAAVHFYFEGKIILRCMFKFELNLGINKYGARLRVDTYWNKSTIPEKFRRKEKPERVKVILEEVDEATNAIES